MNDKLTHSFIIRDGETQLFATIVTAMSIIEELMLRMEIQKYHKALLHATRWPHNVLGRYSLGRGKF